jgi:O-antigen ligase
MIFNNKRILFLGMAGLMIFMPIARGAVKVWSMAPFLLVAYALIFVWLWNKVPGPFLTKRCQAPYSCGVRHLFAMIFIFGLLAVVSFIFSIYKHDSFFALLRLFAYIGIFFLLVNNFDGQMFRRLLGLVVLMGTVLSLYGILQYVDFFEHSWWIPKQFLAASYVNHNHFAGYLELAIPVTLGTVFSRSVEFRFKKIILGFALCIQAMAFILTQSRGAWLSLLLALLVMGLVLIKNKELKVKYFIIFIILAAVSFGGVCFNDNDVSQRVRTVDSPGRSQIWEGAVAMIKDKPLIGVGIGDFDAGFYRFRPGSFDMRAVYAHNDYLHMAAEMGVLAPLLMLLIFGALIVAGIRQGSHSLVLGCAMGVLSLSLHGFVDFNFHIPANMLLFTVCAAYVMRPRQDK